MSGQRFDPYRVADSGRSVEDVFAEVNRAVWLGYGPDYSVGGVDKVVAGPLFDFVTLLDRLTQRSDARFVTHRELITQPASADEVRIAIRHDIDSDIVAAVHQAQIEEEFGVPATWLVLHTAAYYGEVGSDGRFLRHEAMGAVYRELQDRGHEVALHTDPLGLFQRNGIDGAEAVVEELRWLRSLGLEIDGATAHNHRPTYGAENYEVFTGWVSPADNAQPADASWVTHNGAGAPLRVLDERELGLAYEGNEAFWNHPRPVIYGALRFSNLWNFRPHRRRQRRSPTLDLTFADQDRVIHEVLNAAPGHDVILVVHPEYYGVRHHDGPPKRTIERSPVAQTALGSRGWAAGAVVARALRRPGGESDETTQTAQAVNVANEWGMLDLPVAARSPAERTVLVCGGAQIDAAHLAIPTHCSTRLGALAGEHSPGGMNVYKVAATGASVGELQSMLDNAIERLGDGAPDAVVLAVGSQLLNDSVGQGCASERDWLDELESMIWSVDRMGIRCVLLVDDASDADSLEDRSRRDRLIGLGATTGCRVVVPQHAQRLESTRLGALGLGRGWWNATEHRVASEHLYRALFDHDEAPVRAATHAATQQPPQPAELDRLREARLELGVLDFPVPFAGAIAIVSDIDGSSSHRYRKYMGELVDRLGLDHGDSIHLAGYHQRHARNNAQTSRLRSILTHDLRRDNVALKRPGSWFAHVAGEFHRGNIDHLHGLWAWGARSLPVTVKPRSGSTCVLVAPPGAGAGSEGSVGFSLNASAFPLVSVVVETTEDQVPSTILSQRASEPRASGGRSSPRLLASLLSRRSRRAAAGTEAHVEHDPDNGGLASVPLHLRNTQRSESGTTLATWSVPRRALAPTTAEAVELHAEWATRELLIGLPAESIVSAALHNTDSAGLDWALTELRRRLHLAFDLVTTHGRYHFSTTGVLPLLMEQLAGQGRAAGNEPVALFGQPTWAGAAATATADDPASPAFVAHSLRRNGLRHLTPAGLIMESEATFTVDDATFLTEDRSGAPVRFLRRTRPRASNGSALTTSRLSTFETRLRSVLDLLDSGTAGVWPIYTHLGQVVDLDSPPEPWFRHGVVDELSRRYFGDPEAPGARPWVTRASVLANYASALQDLPSRAVRVGDSVTIDLSGMRQDRFDTECRTLFGVSFAVADPRSAQCSVHGDHAVVTLPLVRWLARSAVTAVPCGIEWPIIGSADPVAVAAETRRLNARSDIASVSLEGEWTWSTSEDSAAYGELRCGPEGSASIELAIGDMSVAGAQVILARVYRDAAAELAVVARSEGGAVWHASTTGALPSPVNQTAAVGTFALDPTAGQWEEIAIPLWGFEWNGEVPDHRTIGTVRMEISGPPGAVVAVGAVRLGRPRATLGGTSAGEPRIGGDATGHSEVHVLPLSASWPDGDQPATVPVDAEGFFVTPPLPPGSWLVSAGDQRRVVQVDRDRFDVDLSAY